MKLVAESLDNFLYNITPDKNTDLFLEGKISYKEWRLYFNSLNEGKIKDFVQEKILPTLNSIANKLKEGGKLLVKSMLAAMKAVGQWINKLIKNNPKLFKILILMLLLLIIGTVVAVAQSSGTDPDAGYIDYLNTLLGYIEMQIQNYGKDMDLTEFKYFKEAQTIIINLRDNIPEEQRMEVSKEAMNLVDHAVQRIHDSKDYEGMEQIKLLGEKIAGYVQNIFSYTTEKGAGSRSSFSIIYK